MTYTLIFLMILFIFLGIILTKKVINPLSAFNLIWLVVIAMYQLRLSELQDILNDESVITFIICILSFSITFILGYVIKIKQKERKESNKIIEYDTIKKIFIFWLIIEFIETVWSGGLPILWKITGSSKTYMNYGIPTLHGLMNSIGLVIIMLSFYLYMYKKQKDNVKDRRLLVILLVVTMFSLCLITRQVIITAIIEMMVIYLYFKVKIPWKKIIIIVCVGVIAFGVIGNFRTGYDEFLDVSLMKNNNIPKSLIGVYWVYMYLTMTVANVKNAVLLGINDYGITPIASVYIPTVISNLLFSNSNIKVPNYLVTRAFNVSGFFIDFYIGYGNLGVAIISAIYGLLGAYTLKKVTKKQNEKNILYYAIYLQIVLLSFFYNHLLYLPSGFQFVIVYIIFKIFDKKSKYRKESQL